jgi:hypothetical protein
VTQIEQSGLVSRRSLRRLSAYAAGLLALAIAPGALAGSASTVSAVSLPDPCQAIPSADIAAAFHVETAPPGNLSVVSSSETCLYTYKRVGLSVFVGTTSIGSPGNAKKAVKVPNLPHGYYATFTNTKQTQVSFFKGSAATGVYGIVRSSTAKVTKSHLVAIARDLYASI